MEHTFIHQTDHGQVFVCNQCDRFHFEFGNVVLMLNNEQFAHFCRGILSLDGATLDKDGEGAGYRRRIHIPVAGCQLRFVLNQEELTEVKELLWGAIARKGLEEPATSHAAVIN